MPRAQSVIKIRSVFHDTVLRYLGPLSYVADIPGRRTLHSMSTNRLDVFSLKLSSIGSQAFSVAA